MVGAIMDSDNVIKYNGYELQNIWVNVSALDSRPRLCNFLSWLYVTQNAFPNEPLPYMILDKVMNEPIGKSFRVDLPGYTWVIMTVIHRE